MYLINELLSAVLHSVHGMTDQCWVCFNDVYVRNSGHTAS